MANIKQNIEYDGKIYTNYSQVARVAEVPYRTLLGKIKQGLSVEDAVLEIYEKQSTSNEVKDVEIKDVVKDNNDELELTDNDNNESELMEDYSEYDYTVDSESSNLNRPIYFSVNDPKELIEEISKMNISTINLIDFENMNSSKVLSKEIINKDNTLNIFFYNACIYSNNFFKVIKHCTNINIQVHVYEHCSQLVDHLIVYYLGALYSNFSDKKFNIISKDIGFYGFINSLYNSNINGIGINYIEDKELRFKYSLCKYIATNKIFEHRNLISMTEFPKIFESFYNRKISNEKTLKLINTLVHFEIAETTKRGGFIWVKFDMDAIKDFLRSVDAA